MSATFGELTGVARAHLEAAQRQDLDDTTLAQRRAITHALDSCLQSVARLVAVPPHRPRSDPDPTRRRADAVMYANVQRARQLLRTTVADAPIDDPARSHAAAAHLVMAGSAIGASRDLLETHTLWTASGPRDLSPIAAHIDTPETRHQLLVTAATYADQLAGITSTLAAHVRAPTPGVAAAVRDAARHVAAAADCIGERPSAGTRETRRLEQVAALAPLRLEPVQPRETPTEMLARAVAGAERLHLHAFRAVSEQQSDRHTAGAFVPVAVAMATTHLATMRILESLLIAHDHQQPAEATALDAHQLRHATSAAETAFRAWHGARQGWRDIRVQQSRPEEPALHTEATALATRMGRLAYAELGWAPRPGTSHTPLPIQELATDAEQLKALLDGMQHLAAVSGRIAMEYARMIDAFAKQSRVLVRTRTLPETADIPRPWTLAPGPTSHTLRAAYVEASSAAADSCQTLRRVTDGLHVARHAGLQPQPVEDPATDHKVPFVSRPQWPTHALRDPVNPADRAIEL